MHSKLPVFEVLASEKARSCKLRRASKQQKEKKRKETVSTLLSLKKFPSCLN